MTLFKQTCASCGSQFIQPTLENTRGGDPWYKLTPQRMVCPVCRTELHWGRVSRVFGQVPLYIFMLGGVINLFVQDKETCADVMECTIIAMLIGLFLWFAFRKVQING